MSVAIRLPFALPVMLSGQRVSPPAGSKSSKERKKGFRNERERLAGFNRANCGFWLCAMWSVNSENPEKGFGEKTRSGRGGGSHVQPLVSPLVPSPCRERSVSEPRAAQLCLHRP